MAERPWKFESSRPHQQTDPASGFPRYGLAEETLADAMTGVGATWIAPRRSTDLSGLTVAAMPSSAMIRAASAELFATRT